jgi:RHS repeat-associated protein
VTLTLVANRKSDASDISTFTYTLDGAGMRRTMAIAGSAYTSASVVYDYDGAYQLTKETRTGGSAYTKEYWYDTAGNRTKSALGGTPTQYYYDNTSRMTKYGTVAVGWNDRGDVTSIGSHGYSWDYSDRLTKFDKSGGTSDDATYGYIGDTWKRYKRVQGTTTEYYVYDGDNVIGSYASDGTLNGRYITPGLDANLAETRSGSAYYYMADGLGSVRNLVDASETVQNTYDYYGFGDSLGATQGVTNPYRFTGREYEAGSVLDMHYYRNRYYLPGLGIFMSRDAAWADEARGWGYVRNSPTASVDAFGLFGCKPVGARRKCHGEGVKKLNVGDNPEQIGKPLLDAIDDLMELIEAMDKVGELTGDGPSSPVGNPTVRPDLDKLRDKLEDLAKSRVRNSPYYVLWVHICWEQCTKGCIWNSWKRKCKWVQVPSNQNLVEGSGNASEALPGAWNADFANGEDIARSIRKTVVEACRGAN